MRTRVFLPLLSQVQRALTSKGEVLLLLSHLYVLIWLLHPVILFSYFFPLEYSLLWGTGKSAGGSKKIIPMAAQFTPVFDLLTPSDLYFRPQWDTQTGKTWSMVLVLGCKLGHKTPRLNPLKYTDAHCSSADHSFNTQSMPVLCIVLS